MNRRFVRVVGVISLVLGVLFYPIFCQQDSEDSEDTEDSEDEDTGPAGPSLNLRIPLERRVIVRNLTGFISSGICHPTLKEPEKWEEAIDSCLASTGYDNRVSVYDDLRPAYYATYFSHDDLGFHHCVYDKMGMLGTAESTGLPKIRVREPVFEENKLDSSDAVTSITTTTGIMFDVCDEYASNGIEIVYNTSRLLPHNIHPRNLTVGRAVLQRNVWKKVEVRPFSDKDEVYGNLVAHCVRYYVRELKKKDNVLRCVHKHSLDTELMWKWVEP